MNQHTPQPLPLPGLEPPPQRPSRTHAMLDPHEADMIKAHRDKRQRDAAREAERDAAILACCTYPISKTRLRIAASSRVHRPFSAEEIDTRVAALQAAGRLCEVPGWGGRPAYKRIFTLRPPTDAS